ncbi:hypothetical protein [Sphingobacterium multivorum]|uniref:hypothetical protein n=1 Tax=Sphingobacterium multivorum TaxID=28454 RepID=UPI00289A2497|nr:hypothetical protein [Sphingobacterium multivorum]
MENSELQQKIINLGKLFVKELKLEPGVDTFSRWMAHYLAEKMIFVEQSTGRERAKAEKDCFDVILKLWNHRHTLPSGRRPFENFEQIFSTLARLDPDKTEPYFYKRKSKGEIDLGSDTSESKSVEKWMQIAEDIDKSARIWIEYVLRQALSHAKNENTKEWVENAISSADRTDADVIQLLIDKNPMFDIDNYDEEEFSVQYESEKLKKRISQLRKYAQFNDTLLKKLELDLEKLARK